MIKIKEPVICGSEVVIIRDGNEYPTRRRPEQLIFELINDENIEIENVKRKELAQAFITACEKDLMKAFISCYYMWLERYEDGDWTKERFEKRMGRLKGHPFAFVGGEKTWEQLNNIIK